MTFPLFWKIVFSQCFEQKGEKLVTTVTPVLTSIWMKAAAHEASAPNEGVFEEIGSQTFQICIPLGGTFPPTPPTVPNTNPEFSYMVMKILHGAIGDTFGQRRENVEKTMRNGGCRIPPIPLETL